MGLIEVTSERPDVDRIEIRVDGALAGVLRRAPFRLPFDFGDGSTGRTIRADLFAAGYSVRESATLTTMPLDATEVTIDWVELPVDLRGRSEVDPASIEVRENGVVQAVRKVERVRGPARFVFVIDRSLSMRGGRLEQALAAVRATQPRLRADDRAEVILFNHRIEPPVPLSEAVSAEASGGTALRDALASIRPDERTIAIVLSDGGDRSSFLPRDEALARVGVSRLTVHAIALGRGDGTDFLREAARRTGGLFLRSGDGSLRRELGHLFDEIDARWTVSWQSTLDGRGWRTIDVAARERGLSVRSLRRGYFAE